MKKSIFLSVLFTVLPQVILAQAQLHWETKFTAGCQTLATNPLDDQIIYVASGTGFNVTYDLGNTWERRYNQFGNNLIRNIVVCPLDTSVIVVYHNLELMRSTDGGYSWNKVLDDVSMNGETLEFHPLNPDTVFFVEFNEGLLWASEDRGENWSVRANIGIEKVCSFTINPHNPRQMIVGAANGRVKKSEDSGHSWITLREEHGSFSEIPKIKWDPINSDYIYGSLFSENIYSFIRINNTDNTWQTKGLYGLSMWAMDIALNGNIYLGTYNLEDQPDGIYKSYDSGNSWQKIGSESPDKRWALKTNSDSVINIVYTSPGQGLLQMRIPQLGYLKGTLADSISGTSIDYFTISVAETGDIIYAGNDSGAYMLAMLPGTYTFTFTAAQQLKEVQNITIVEGDTTLLDLLMPINLRELALKGIVKGEQQETIPAIVKLNYTRLTEENVTLIDTTQGDGVFDFGGLYSTAAFNNLYIQPLVLPYHPVDYTDFYFDSLQTFGMEYADILIADANNNLSARAAFEQAYVKNDLSAVTVAVTLSAAKISSNAISKTHKNTLMWLNTSDSSAQNTALLDSIQKITSAGSNIILIGQNIVEDNQQHSFFSDLGLSHNGNFSIFGFNDPVKGFDSNPVTKDISFNILPANHTSPDIFSVTGDYIHKAFYYGNNLADTTNIAGVTIANTGNDGKALILGFNLHNQSSTLIEEILRRGVDYFDGVINSLDGNIDLQPEVYRLDQNYPNPFNPVTKIGYMVRAYRDKPLRVNLSVYTLLGRKIKTLVNKKQKPGNYQVLFDASHLASGVYYYTLQVADFVQTKKMLLIR